MTYTWNCTHCRKPIADGKGYLSLDLIDANQALRERAASYRSRTSKLTRLANLDLPQPIPWLPMHSDCDPEDRNAYCIDVGRARTAHQLLARTLHLSGKRWYSASNWVDLIQHKIRTTT